MELPFFTKLAICLANGVEQWTAEERRRFARFFLNSEDRSNGGFTGRKGQADVYYTSFALRGLALLGELENVQAPALERFLENVLDQAKQQTLQSTDLISFLFCVQIWDMWTGKSFLQSRLELRDKYGKNEKDDWRIWFSEQFARFRRNDGGYASSDQTAHSSTYHTFLVLNAFESLFHNEPNFSVSSEEQQSEFLLRTVERRESLWQFLAQRQRNDGGFVELEPLRHSGTNPTVAGIGLLRFLRNRCVAEDSDSAIFNRIDIALCNAFRYLKSQQSSEGGFRANNRVPIPDLLSTFTVLTVLTDSLNCTNTSEANRCDSCFDLASVSRFVRSLRKETPKQFAYVGGLWDNEPDVEFTFYGLAAECLLRSI